MKAYVLISNEHIELYEKKLENTRRAEERKAKTKRS